MLTLEELEASAMPCRMHARLCTFETCRIPLCWRHAHEAEDGKTYCLSHFRAVSEAIKATHGVVLGGLLVFANSLFDFIDPETLE